MSTRSAPQVTRGEILLQPSFFTSSLFVEPLREDIRTLLRTFTQAYSRNHSHPFQTFKSIWTESGWHLLHLKVYDARARETFVRVVFMLFVERLKEKRPAIERAAALFGLYVFHQVQPSASLRKVDHIGIPIDIYTALLALPTQLTPQDLAPLRAYTTHVFIHLLKAQAFHILPHSSLHPGNPSRLPREYVITDDLQHISSAQESPARREETPVAGESTDATPGGAPTTKKKGRPTRRDKAKKARDALGALDRWLDKSTYTYIVPSTTVANEGEPPAQHVLASAESMNIVAQATPEESSSQARTKTTHTLISHPPTASRAIYAVRKNKLLDIIHSSPQVDHEESSQLREALRTANTAVLTRLRRIDELVAERGLEVGAEGGELTGLGRVEGAVAELDEASQASGVVSSLGKMGQGGILGLLEGAGLRQQE